MPFWILSIVIVIVAMIATIFAVREHSRELSFGAMAMVIAAGALIILAVVFLR